jgi:hypothetical protein
MNLNCVFIPQQQFQSLNWSWINSNEIALTININFSEGRGHDKRTHFHAINYK